MEGEHGMTNSGRWLVCVGWGLPVGVAAALAVVRRMPHGVARFGGGTAVLLLVAPVVPLSLILFALAIVAERQALRFATSRRSVVDRAFLGAALLGAAASLAWVVAAAVVYVV
jgi:hypothetical protein